MLDGSQHLNLFLTGSGDSQEDVTGLKSASIKPPTTALNPVAWLGPKLTVMRMIDMLTK